MNQYDLQGNFIRKWDTAQQTGVELNLGSSVRNIPAVSTGKRNNTCGYIWRYAEDLIEDEIWKPMIDPCYFGTEISNMGRVKSPKGNIIDGYTSKSGYKLAALINPATKTTKKFPVHRLVMEVFHGPRDDLQVNHIDGDKINNKLENLEYVTASENILHAHRTNLVKQYCRPVIKTILATGEEITYHSIKEAAEQNVLGKTAIRNRCTGETKCNGKDGIHWRYADSDITSTKVAL